MKRREESLTGLQVRVKHDNKKTLIQFNSVVTWDYINLQDEIVQHVKNAASSRIVLDFSDLEEIEFQVLEIMGEIAERYRKKDYSFIIRNPDKKLIQQLVLSGLTRFFVIKF